tara:strand:+ start:670 stop:816 length:147 start_codon:yes stop_codon:yes gene_type:complete
MNVANLQPQKLISFSASHKQASSWFENTFVVWPYRMLETTRQSLRSMK